MTCGIYLLVFDGTHKIYVGQSENIEGRYRDHIAKFKSRKQAAKLMSAYEEFGFPKLEIEMICAPEELDAFEQYYINLWKAVPDGFNTMKSPGPSDGGALYCEHNGASKYTRNQILKVFDMLCAQEPYLFIHNETGVSLDTIRDILSKGSHIWLKYEFPTKYSLLEKYRAYSKNSAEARGIKYPPIISPEGKIYTVTNTYTFAIEHKLDNGHLGKVLNGKAKSHKGWKLA